MEGLAFLYLLEKVLWGGFAGAAVLLFATLKIKKKEKLATSQLADIEDLGRLRGNDGFRVSKNFQLNFKKSKENVVVVAPPGEGKTTSLFYINLLSNDFPRSSIIITDKKGELYRDTKFYQEKVCGRRVILFTPLDNNARCNLLELCKDFREVRELATNIITNAELAVQLAGNRSAGSAEWPNMALPLFTAVLLYCKSLNFPYNNITEAYRILLTNNDEQLERLFSKSKTEVIEQFLIYKSCLDSGELTKSNGTSRSIKITLLTSLALFGDKMLQYTMSKSDFTPETLRKEPIALYIQYREEEYLAPYMSVFYSFFIKRLMYHEDKNRLPVFFLLDEFQNLGRVTGIQTVLAECRDAEMCFMICLQNLVRLYQIYGKESAITIWNCLKTKCALPSLTDYEALNLLSIYSGYKEIEQTSQSGEKTTKSKTKVKVFEADEVRRIPDDHMLVIAHNKLPFLDEQDIYYKNDKYLNNVL